MNALSHLPALLILLGLGTVLAAGARGDEASGEPRRHAGKGPSELPFSSAVELGDFVYLSGALGTLPGSSTLAEGTAAQTRQTLDHLEKTLGELGLDLTRVVEARVYLPDIRVFPEVDAEIGRRFGKNPPTMAVVEAGLVVPGALVEIAVVAVRKGVDIRSILPAGWSEPTAHFRRALLAGDTLFISGQVGVDPKAKATVPGGTAAQAKQAFDNLRQLLEAAGFALGDVTNCRVFLADGRDFPLLNEAWKAVFPTDPPVRETLQGKLTDPELKIEIHCQAVKGRQIVQPGAASQPFSTTVAAGGRLYTAGMIARTPEGWPAGPGEQTKVVLERLGAALKTAGLGPNDVADATVVLADPRYFEAMNAEYRKFFPEGFPTRVTAALPLMAPEALIEISFIAKARPPAPAQ